MPVYKYIAMDKGGARRTGEVDARSKNSAVSLMKEQGYFVISLEKASSPIFGDLFSFRGVPFGEIVTFTRQLATMISAGLSISKSLDVLSQQTTNAKFQKVLGDVLRDVEGGASLANSLGKYPDTFSKTYQALVQAGEASGKLDAILERLADTMEDERELRSKFKGAMIYPTIVMFAMGGVFIILMVFVVPKLADLYESLDVELPAMTQYMITISNFMVDNIIFVLIGLFGMAIGLRYFLKSESFKSFRSRVIFMIPVFGKLTRKKELTDFTRTLGLLITSAVPIVDALHIVSEVVSSKVYTEGALKAAERIEKGGSLSNYLKGDDNFPPILGNMVATGEETGKLDEILAKLAEFFKSETDHAVDGLSAALEPIILIMLGTMVAFLIISIITPIYKITSAI